MHVRFTTSLGTRVLGEDAGHTLGTIAGILIHPDTAKVEGFFVRTPGWFSPPLFLSSIDIRRWGTAAHVRDHDALSPLHDRIRLQALAAEGRPLIGQQIRTESGRILGRCADVQFDTLHFLVERIWPRSWWRWKRPIPVRQILEVRKDAIIIRDAAVPEPDAPQVPAVPMPVMPEAA